MHKYFLSNDAEDDLRRIHEYGSEKFGELQADSYLEKLIDQFDKIAENPLAFPIVESISADYRRSVCGVDSVYYRIGKEHVEIVAIIGRQEITNHLSSK